MLMEFDQVEYSYPANSSPASPAINGLSLAIPQGAYCAVIGHNGCGKTTLFRLANALYRPQKGVIRWQGSPLKYDRASLTQLRQQVGLVFQDPEQQLVATTVEEDLSYGLCNLGLPAAEITRRVQETLALFDLVELAHTPIHYLSLGQKKRLSIADVVILQPQLLLLDEPTAYLDPKQKENLITILDKIRTMGTTLVMATHDLNFVYAYADWLFVLDRGQLILEGQPQTLLSQPETFAELELGIPLVVKVIQQVSFLLQQEPSLSEAQRQAIAQSLLLSLAKALRR